MKIQEYRINTEEISLDDLRAIVQQFLSSDVPAFKYRKNYYDGKQKILNRQMDVGKPNNKIVANFIHSIVDNYAGYAVGKPVSYYGENSESIIDILKYNDVQDEDTQFYTDALIYGRSCEICYLDSDGETRFTVLPPTECIPVYDCTLEKNLKLAIRVYQYNISSTLTPIYRIEVYDNKYMTLYNSDAGFTTFQFLDKAPHFFNQVPVTFLELNKDVAPVAEQIYGLQDAYNSLISDSINDWDAFCDAYLVLKGAIADDDDLKNMKSNRCILLDADSDASFLTKATNTTEIENLLKTVETKVWEMSNCVNFKDETFGTASGVALKYKLLGMENNTASYISRMKKALVKRIELLASILRIKGDDVWADMQIQFTRNLPTDNAENAQVVSQLKGIVSDETLLSLLPFIDDPKEEAKKVNEEKQLNYELYTQNNIEPVKEEDE